ncbi:hypothetical protein ACFY5D_16630 [Paeniglutamicibacter sp. NPDC012692]|uniref:hypothetical protein n=1 Tax=Paeniglutamicibacter sp. NPDC012692 TaxID=3364388 RepID=UPI003689D24E
MTWRYIAQSVPSGEFIDLDLPLTNVSVTKAISGPGSITGTIPIEYAALRKSNGQLALREWGTMIHIEEDGVILQSAIVDQLEIDGDQLTLQAGGFSMMPNATPWLGNTKNYINADPLDILRDIWDHIQSQPNGDLGMTLDPLKSPARVGIPEAKNLTAAKGFEAKAKLLYENEVKRSEAYAKDVETAKKAVFYTANVTPVGQIYVAKSAPSGDKKARGNIWIDSDSNNAPYTVIGSTWEPPKVFESEIQTLATRINTYVLATKQLADHKQVLANAKENLSKATEKRKELSDGEAKPIRLAWWETDNLQTVINDLVDSAPFEYAERSHWDGEEIKYHLDLGYPAIGSRKENARFEIGVNVSTTPRISLDDYASEVLMFGAGEGSARVRGHLTTPTDRLRRVAVKTDQSITSTARAETVARPLLKELNGDRSIDSLTIIDHPLAPLGTFQPGDQIRVIGDAGWGDLDMWVRILELTSTPDNNSISLKVVTI